MQSHHVIMLVIVGVVGYVLGAKFPMWAQRFGF